MTNDNPAEVPYSLPVIKIPGYIIKREIGTGGMATVYLAVQASLEREVALKVMTPALAADRAFSKRFVREARTIAGLNHPNIVPIYEVGVTEDSHHFFSMQHLVGGDLTDRIRGGIDEPELIRVLIGISRALGFAHRHGFVHRDVTPGNIMFDGSNTPILTDFGIARGLRQDTRITGTGVSIGTSHYMSPEQARSGDISPRSDLYSLGVVAFEALAGHPPYQGDDGFAVAYAHVYDPIPELPQAKAHWQEFINQSMAKDPKDRFADAEAVVAALLEHSRHRVSESLNPELEAVAGKLDSPFTQRWRKHQRWLNRWLVKLRVKPVTGQVSHWLKKTSSTVASGYEEIHDRVPRRLRPIIELSAIGLCVLLIGYLAYLLWPDGDSKPPTVAGGVADTQVSTTAGNTADTNNRLDPDTGPGDENPGDSQTSIGGESDTPPPGGDSQDSSDEDLDPRDDLLADSDSPPLDTDADLPGISFDGDQIQAQVTEAADAARRVQEIRQMLDQADADLAGLRLMTPADGNAFDRYTQVLALDPGNERAANGLQAVLNKYISLARESLSQGNYEDALTYLNRADRVSGSNPIARAGLDVAQSIRDEVFGQQLQLGEEALAQWDHLRAQSAYELALAFRPGDPRAEEGLASAQQMASSGYRFADPMASGGEGPQLVTVPPGDFRLGGKLEQTVAVTGGRRFGISRFEITLAQFRRFVEATNYFGEDAGTPCRDLDSRWRASRDMTWLTPGFPQADNHPVVCVTFEAAQAYTNWLSTETGASYRLPSEAEWEYVASYQMTDSWPAPEQRCELGNVGDLWLKSNYPDREIHNCEDNWAFTSPAGSFGANPSGVNDMTGNVREWVADCSSPSHEGHSGTMSPRLDANCGERVVKGSAWLTGPEGSVPWYRFAARPGDAFNTIGFRVVRVMD